MNPYDKFCSELEHLETLYVGSIFAYDQAVERNKERIQSGFGTHEDPIVRNVAKDYKFTIAKDTRSLNLKFKKQLRKYLYEILFVRAISILEVYLIDIVRELFLEKRDLFKSNEIESFSYSHLLSFRSPSEIATYLINKECRALQNKGFNNIALYFKRKFNIDFNTFILPLAKIEEYHDRRHLLVHRLGRTDQKYRHNYNYNSFTITIDKKYFIESIDTLRLFGDFINNEVNKIINMPDRTRPDNVIQQVSLKINPITRKGERAIQHDYTFMYQDEILSIKDVLFNQRVDEEGDKELILKGQKKDIDKYVVYLKSIPNDLKINSIEIESNHNSIEKISKQKKRIPYELFCKIRQSLPVEPWPKDIHKDIAQKFDISNKQARKVLGGIRCLNSKDKDKTL